MNALDPLDPYCPCRSGRLLSVCCAAVDGGEYDDDEVDQAMQAQLRFGKRGEFATAVRRRLRELHEGLDEVQYRLLAKHREMDLHLANIAFLHSELPIRGEATIAQLLLRRDGPSLQPRVRALLAQWAAQPVSLYEVLEVFPGQGITMRDLVRKFPVRVHERTASSQVRPGWFLLVRVRRRADGAPVMDPPLLPFAERRREAVLDWLVDEDLDGDDVVGEPRRHLVSAFRLWQFCMTDALTASPPRLQNQHGEELVLCEAEFAVADAAQVRRALAARGDWEVDDETQDEAEQEWTWLEVVDADERRSLGHLRFDGGVVMVETNSRERMAAVRRWLEAVQGVRWVAGHETGGTDLLAKVHASRAGDTEADDEGAVAESMGPPEEVLRSVMDRHYRKWVDEALPMFGGRTPRQMAKVDAKAVARAIWEIGNPPRGAPRYDADWMYEELGVPRLGGGEFRPGVG